MMAANYLAVNDNVTNSGSVEDEVMCEGPGALVCA